MSQSIENANHHPPSLVAAAYIWGKIGLLSFGGPAAQIALMHRILVDEMKWLSEKQYLNALSFCMLLPGPPNESNPILPQIHAAATRLGGW